MFCCCLKSLFLITVGFSCEANGFAFFRRNTLVLRGGQSPPRANKPAMYCERKLECFGTREIWIAELLRTIIDLSAPLFEGTKRQGWDCDKGD